MNIIYCSLDINEFNIIFLCISAKQIWGKLETTFKEANQRKTSSSWADKETHPNLCLMTHEDEKKEKEEIKENEGIDKGGAK